MMAVMRPAGWQGPNNSLIKCFRGHVTAFPNPPVQDLAGVFPMKMEDIPESLGVVFLSPAKDRGEIEEMARKTAALQVCDRRSSVTVVPCEWC